MSGSLKPGGRGALTLANDRPSSGAGVAGACGVNVDIWSRNGCPESALRLTKSVALAPSTVLR
ncbi:hypothetical protein ACFQHO_26560 [Actinomadura yumaensis]|uniref:hypothetical protein n=1 Tax=Actinomadura yumaensis TaxID=111807 RepID=UPI00362413BB